jgi:hypothetical protein
MPIGGRNHATRPFVASLTEAGIDAGYLSGAGMRRRDPVDTDQLRNPGSDSIGLSSD